MKKVTVNGTVTSHERYLYRGHLQIAALDMLNSWNVLRTLLWDPLEEMATRPLTLVQDASLYCYGTDFNKNVTEVFDGQGTIAAAYDYSPYVTGTGSLVQPVQWSSEMNDHELALVYYNYRGGGVLPVNLFGIFWSSTACGLVNQFQQLHFRADAQHGRG